MKQLLLITLLFIKSATFISAQIPNSGFEEWEIDSLGKVRPIDWVVVAGQFQKIDSNALSGNSSMRVRGVFRGEEFGTLLVSVFNVDQLYDSIGFIIKTDTIHPGAFAEIDVNEGINRSIGNFKIDTEFPNPKRIAIPLNHLNIGALNIQVNAFHGDSDGNIEFLIDDFELIPKASTSLKNPIKDKIVLYPNPTQNKLNLKLPTPPNNNTKALIFNTLGHLVQKETFIEKESSIDVSALKSGIYFLKINLDGQEVIQRFVISR